jgi:thioredoxin reductase (NADPH)
MRTHEELFRQKSRKSPLSAPAIGLELAASLKRAGVDYLHFDARQIGYTSPGGPGTPVFLALRTISDCGIPIQNLPSSV